MALLRGLSVGFAVTSLIACSTTDTQTVMEPYETELGVGTLNAKNFHTLLHFPSGTALHYPGYIVALEKSPQVIVGGPKPYPQVSFVRSGQYIRSEQPSAGDTSNVISRFQRNDSKAMFVSHIVQNRTYTNTAVPGKPYTSTDHCFVYNAYAAKPLALIKEDYDLAKISDWHACDIATNLDLVDAKTQQLYDYGKYALVSLQTNLTQDLKDGSYTHVLVIIMGWNTSQQEAVRNFNDLTGNVIAASLEPQSKRENAEVDRQVALAPPRITNAPFRPLVVGVTWPSYWSNTVGNALSYSNKAGDADEIGLSWLNKIINEVIPNSLAASGSQARVVTLGHSFGARAMTRAVFSSPALVPIDNQFPDQTMITSPVDLAVALQGAMSINRFVPELSSEGAPYRDFAQLKKTRLVYTAAANDSATGAPYVLWTSPAGSISSYRKACDDPASPYSGIFECMTASDTSAIPSGTFSLCKRGQPDCQAPATLDAALQKVVYIDASNGITEFNSPGSGGHAHSDIYRLPMGRLLWTLIGEYAPAR